MEKKVSKEVPVGVGAAVPWGSATAAPAPRSGQSPSGRRQRESGQPRGTGMLLHVPVTGMVLRVTCRGPPVPPCHRGALAHPHCGGASARPHLRAAPTHPRRGDAPAQHRCWLAASLQALTPGDMGTGVAPAGAEEMLMGPQLVPWGLQHLPPFTACQDPPTALPVSVDHAVRLCLAGPPLPPAQQIQPPRCGQLFPAPRPSKIQFTFPRNQPAIFTAGEKAAVEEGGRRPGREVPSHGDAASTCRAACQLDGGRTASSSPRRTAAGKGGKFSPKNNGEEGSPLASSRGGGLNPAHGTR